MSQSALYLSYCFALQWLKVAAGGLMSDIFDFILFFILSTLLAVLKITGFISLNWWIIAAPSIFAVCVHILICFERN